MFLRVFVDQDCKGSSIVNYIIDFMRRARSVINAKKAELVRPNARENFNRRSFEKSLAFFVPGNSQDSAINNYVYYVVYQTVSSCGRS
jgi:hypothetical protein